MLNGPDVVTIGLYTLETEDGKYNSGFLKQDENIKRIVDGLTEAALKNGKQPPTFVLSVLMVPNWKKPENGFDNDSYQETKAKFINEAREHFERLGVQVQDFLVDGQLTPSDLEYMVNLTATGSVADIIKTRAIINNIDVPHLQLDSNTIISNFNAFYQHTFGADQEQQKDGLNACYYRSNLAGHLDAHNKAVYTTPNGKVAGALAKTYAEYIEEHKNDAIDKKNNNIYENVFGPALCKVGLTFENINVTRMTKFYPPEIDQPEYEMTKFIVTAVNMSWAAKGNVNLQTEELKKERPFRIDDAMFDFQSFSYLVKKYTEHLKKNASESIDPNLYFQKFLDISDNQLNVRLLGEYYQHIRQNRSDLLPTLANTFPDTPKGNILVNALFGCNVQDLRENPERDNSEVIQHDINQMKEQLIAVDKEALQIYVRRPKNYITDAYVTKLFSGGYDSSIHLKDSPEKNHHDFVAAIKGKTHEELMGQEKYQTIATVYQLFSAIENGGDQEQVFSLLREIAERDIEIFYRVKEEAIAIISNSNDNEWHFNFIPNRQESLFAVTHFEPLARVHAVKLREPIANDAREPVVNEREPANDRRPRALSASFNHERSQSEEKSNIQVNSHNDVNIQQDVKKEADESKDNSNKHRK